MYIILKHITLQLCVNRSFFLVENTLLILI